MGSAFWGFQNPCWEEQKKNQKTEPQTPWNDFFRVVVDLMERKINTCYLILSCNPLVFVFIVKSSRWGTEGRRQNVRQFAEKCLDELSLHINISPSPHTIHIFYCHYSRILSEAHEVTEFPNLNGTTSLEILRLDRANIVEIPKEICKFCPRLKQM